MNVVLGTIAAGKTMELVKKCKEANGQFVCSSQYQCDVLWTSEMYKQSGLIDKPITFRRAMTSPKKFKPLFIDDIEHCLSFIINSVIDTVSVTMAESDFLSMLAYSREVGFLNYHK